MAVMNFLILTYDQRDAAFVFDNADVRMGGRAIDGSSPGVGLNLNDNAANFDVGDPVPLVGKWVVPKRLVDDPEYITYAIGMVTYLLDKPFALLETETIFAPQEEV